MNIRTLMKRFVQLTGAVLGSVGPRLCEWYFGVDVPPYAELIIFFGGVVAGFLVAAGLFGRATRVAPVGLPRREPFGNPHQPIE
jgi:hypothetical protein